MKNKLRIAIVVSKFNQAITQSLLACCRDQFLKKGISNKNIFVLWVPGAYELPFAVHQLAKTKKFSAVIGLGCVIKGETSHDEHVTNWSSMGIGLVSLLTGIPCFFGVLSPKNEAQAWKRAKPGPLNRGKEIADAVLEMLDTPILRSR